MKSALLIFVKNLERGKVKTRLAAAVGDDGAYRIYKYLRDYTYQAAAGVAADKYVWYSDFPEEDDGHSYHREVQSDTDLGERMQNAFAKVFGLGFGKAVIIGSDNLEITSAIINEALDLLDETDVVIGPASDGGYYLLGMKALHPQLFTAIAWSTGQVYGTTVNRINQMGLSYQNLIELRDIDEEQDWNFFKSRVQP